MPQMDAPPFDNPSNARLMDAIRGISGSDFQQRVPSATKAGVQESFKQMWDYGVTRNQFIDALVNVIGAQIIRYNTWNNPLAKYKRGLLTYGETIEEVAVGLLNAYHYSQNREYLERDIFGKEPNEVQSRFHKVNREDFYKLTVKEETLKRAFYNEGGLSKFVSALMSQINTSDQWDEFLLMSRLFKIYDDEGGFFNVQVPNISSFSATGNDAKQFLKQVRSLADTLPFLSRAYNAAHMPVTVQPSQLELIITPEAQANIDVEALSASFNVDKAQVQTRVTVMPQKYIGIKGFQALLTTRDFFVVADNLLEMRQAQNPVGLHNNYFWHHWETISASPFVPAIKFTLDAATPIIIDDRPVDAISTITLKDQTGNTVTTAPRGDAILVTAVASTNPDGGPNDGVTLSVHGRKSTRTRITQTGILFVGYDESAPSLTVRATATDDTSFYRDLVVPLTGPVAYGTVGAAVDNDATTLSNTRKPGISPQQNGRVGDEFSTNNGSWDQNPDSYTYQWKRAGTAINGATSNQYVAQAADAGQVLTVDVTAAKTNFAPVTVTTAGVTVSTS